MRCGDGLARHHCSRAVQPLFGSFQWDKETLSSRQATNCVGVRPIISVINKTAEVDLVPFPQMRKQRVRTYFVPFIGRIR